MQMNVGLALDEGLANPANTYTIFYGERAPWWLNVIAEGAAGHGMLCGITMREYSLREGIGSRFVEPSAVERLLCVLDKARAFRADMAKKVAGEHGCGKPLGDVTTLNITMLSGTKSARRAADCTFIASSLHATQRGSGRGSCRD